MIFSTIYLPHILDFKGHLSCKGKIIQPNSALMDAGNFFCEFSYVVPKRYASEIEKENSNLKFMDCKQSIHTHILQPDDVHTTG